jgi:hypothetical protein
MYRVGNLPDAPAVQVVYIKILSAVRFGQSELLIKISFDSVS